MSNALAQAFTSPCLHTFSVYLLCVLPMCKVIPSRGGIYMLLLIATTEYVFINICALSLHGIDLLTL